MLLTADIGNTSITLGLFDNEALIEDFRLASDKDLSLEEYEVLLKSLFKNYDIKGCIISSVVEELNEKFTSAVYNVFKIKPLMLSAKVNTGIKINMPNLDEVGADRIANAAGAYVLYNHPVIVIDFGTATTFDIVDKNSCFIGGIIAPGLKIQANSLSQFTSKLPKLKIEAPKRSIGKDTISAMLSGIVLGHKCLIEGMIKKCEQELNEKATIIATGGFSSVLFDNMDKIFDYIDKDLTLFGLKELYYLNKEEKND